MIRVYTQIAQGQQWMQQYRGHRPIVACILGFTATALIPGISAAGATPEDRKYTAIADAEFLVNGVTPQPQYPLPPLVAGASPVLISRAVVEAFDLPVYLFNAGLPHPPTVPAIDLGGVPANCLTSGDALPLDTVKHLFEQGLKWGKTLAEAAGEGYLIISECVVGGTTTALSILTALGIDASGKINSSHPTCNHAQKWEIVQAGLRRWGERQSGRGEKDIGTQGYRDTENGSANFFATEASPLCASSFTPSSIDPFQLVAAVGDPMQIVAAGMAIAAMQNCGVLLAGGTQMLAVYALARALIQSAPEIVARSSGTQQGCGDRTQELKVSKLKALQGEIHADSCLENHQPSTINHQPSTINHQPSTINHQPSIFNLQPSTINHQPSTFNPVSPLIWQPQRVVVGTTRWVAEDPTGDTIGLAQDIGGVPLLATQLSFAASGYPQLQAYEQGYVKEGVGAGGCAIAAHLYKGWNTVRLLQAIEALAERYCKS